VNRNSPLLKNFFIKFYESSNAPVHWVSLGSILKAEYRDDNILFFRKQLWPQSDIIFWILIIVTDHSTKVSNISLETSNENSSSSVVHAPSGRHSRLVALPVCSCASINNILQCITKVLASDSENNAI